MGVEPTCAAPNGARTVLKTAAATGPQPPPRCQAQGSTTTRANTALSELAWLSSGGGIIRFQPSRCNL